MDPSERNQYVSESRAPKRFLGKLSSLIHRSNVAHLITGKKMVLCCCCSPPRRIPRHRPTQKERARPPRPVGPLTSSEELSLNWRTEVTFVTILPTANTCPVQRERAAQTNVSCYTESPAGHRGPSGKAMICRGTDHSFFYWVQVHERQLQTSHILAYLPFRWHQRDQAKVRNFVSRLLHSAAVS